MDEVVEVRDVEIDNVFVVDVVVDEVANSSFVVEVVSVDDIPVAVVCVIVEDGNKVLLVSRIVLVEVDNNVELWVVTIEIVGIAVVVENIDAVFVGDSIISVDFVEVIAVEGVFVVVVDLVDSHS